MRLRAAPRRLRIHSNPLAVTIEEFSRQQVVYDEVG
jgi:hypothetical protein